MENFFTGDGSRSLILLCSDPIATPFETRSLRINPDTYYILVHPEWSERKSSSTDSLWCRDSRVLGTVSVSSSRDSLWWTSVDSTTSTLGVSGGPFTVPVPIVLWGRSQTTGVCQ